MRTHIPSVYAERRPGTAVRMAGRRLLGFTVLLTAVQWNVAALPAQQQQQQTASQDKPMIEAVIESFDLRNRRVYIAPRLGVPDGLLESHNVAGQIRHNAEELEAVSKRFNAVVQQPIDAINCPDPRQLQTCRLPGNGILFEFMLPSPLERGLLPVRIIVYYDGRGEGGQILREAWDFVLTRQPVTGWRVVEKKLFAVAQGPR